jgi:hypothetical protein
MECSARHYHVPTGTVWTKLLHLFTAAREAVHRHPSQDRGDKIQRETLKCCALQWFQAAQRSRAPANGQQLALQLTGAGHKTDEIRRALRRCWSISLCRCCSRGGHGWRGEASTVRDAAEHNQQPVLVVLSCPPFSLAGDQAKVQDSQSSAGQKLLQLLLQRSSQVTLSRAKHEHEHPAAPAAKQCATARHARACVHCTSTPVRLCPDSHTRVIRFTAYSSCVGKAALHDSSCGAAGRMAGNRHPEKSRTAGFSGRRDFPDGWIFRTVGFSGGGILTDLRGTRTPLAGQALLGQAAIRVRTALVEQAQAEAHQPSHPVPAVK